MVVVDHHVYNFTSIVSELILVHIVRRFCGRMVIGLGRLTEDWYVRICIVEDGYMWHMFTCIMIYLTASSHHDAHTFAKLHLMGA